MQNSFGEAGTPEIPHLNPYSASYFKMLVNVLHQHWLCKGDVGRIVDVSVPFETLLIDSSWPG